MTRHPLGEATTQAPAWPSCLLAGEKCTKEHLRGDAAGGGGGGGGGSAILEGTPNSISRETEAMRGGGMMPDPSGIRYAVAGMLCPPGATLAQVGPGETEDHLRMEEMNSQKQKCAAAAHPFSAEQGVALSFHDLPLLRSDVSIRKPSTCD